MTAGVTTRVYGLGFELGSSAYNDGLFTFSFICLTMRATVSKIHEFAF